jgi:PAS domain S-box-containing protein
LREVQEAELSATPELERPSAGDRSTMAQVIAQQAAIAQLGQTALAPLARDALFSEASSIVSRVLETELVDVLELSPDGRSLKIVAGVGWRPGVVGTLEVAAGSGSQSGYTVSSGEPVIVSDLTSEKRFAVPEVLIEHGAVSGMSVRIGDRERPFGVLAAFTSRRGRFTHDDVNFLQAVANILAAAIDRQRVEADLRTSRDELSTIVAGLSEGLTVQGPDGRLIYANDTAAQLSGYETGGALVEAPIAEVMSRFQLFDEQGRPLTLDRLPGRRALAGEDPEPMLIGFRITATGEQRWSLVSAHAVRGPDGSVRRVVNTFRDVTEERWARETRAFMADAVAALSGTLDVAEAASRLADLCVPKLADYCTVDMLEPDGSIAGVALAHADPSRLDLARRARELRPVRADAPAGVARVIREGQPEISEVTPDLIAAAQLSEEELDLMRRLELRWYLCVPLVGRHGPIGALSLVTAESGRRLGERELGLAVELGARAGIALENAQLYQTANDRRAQLDIVLAALVEAVLVFDGNGDLRLGNRAAAETFGGRLPATLDAMKERLGVEPATANPTLAGDVTEVSPDGGRRWFEMRHYGARQESEQRSGGAPNVVVLRDITQAKAARAARDAFMGVLSHELRTPITTIYGGSELLERELDDVRRAEVIADIRVESERLARLIEDLLVMTRVERGMVEIEDEPILLQHLLGSVIGAVTARWPGAKIELNVADRLPAIRGDTTYIEQVLRNLLTNGIRYGRGAESGIEVTVAERDGRIAVRVLDRGPGFGDVDPERLFDLFFRAPAARTVPGGAGIGLFVCRHLIEAMGGSMWARERSGGGAEFGFALPVLEGDVAP